MSETATATKKKPAAPSKRARAASAKAAPAEKTTAKKAPAKKASASVPAVAQAKPASKVAKKAVKAAAPAKAVKTTKATAVPGKKGVAAKSAKAVAKPAPKPAPKAASRPTAEKPAAAPAPTAKGVDTAAMVNRLADDAASNTLALNPMVGVRVEDLGEAVQALIGAVTKQPAKAMSAWGKYVVEVTKVLAGKSSIETDPKDKRFTDPAWRESKLHKGLLQTHTATATELRRFIDASGLNDRDKARVHLVASIYIDTIAPSNALINPMAIKRARETGGKSLVKGFKNLIHDMRHNGGLPSSVDKSKFEIGRNLCLSPGSVVFKNEVLELIQYKPQTDKVYKRPLVICPPQVNKFYALDLSPEKSLVKFATEQGVQIFAVSWRNPTGKQSDWDMSTYVEALDAAVDAAREITGSDDVSLWGACSGGMTAASYVGWLAATDQKKVVNVISPVCTLDPENVRDTSMGLFMTPESVAAIKATVKRKGFVDGAEMARVFAWLRPNDLIWNYWVNNYLLGSDPPAFDILYWNADTTRLPAAFHANILDIMSESPFVHPNKMKVLGKPIDMRKAKVDAYIVAGITDHITPWKACYPTARIYGENSVFTLANAGHLQSLLNPPSSAKSFFLSGKATSAKPDDWATGAPRQDGSWWPHWIKWMDERSGPEVAAPTTLGNSKHKPGAAAPGDYIHEP
ncbi:alpha/beta fold hydrolase [Variovorax sp. J22R133]|uniref:alpha/beta fold hydrolase n=1 Tax=Variovorax brevis TaxID=3053503 RepID=UPI0025751B58|nr:alpha/beta fold hydrolase [Variovorax sp. J22R133]MDM0115230.1 alpha/beta fold hydrolase [Variovorax sp. J22R133]